MSGLNWLAMIGCLTIAMSGCKDKFSEIDAENFILVGDQRCPWRKLAEQGFSARLDNEGYIERLGYIKKSEIYWIFTYMDFDNSQNDRMVIVSSNCRYIGSYQTGRTSFSVGQGGVIFNVPPELGDVITFIDAGPPPTVVVDGKLLKLVR